MAIYLKRFESVEIDDSIEYCKDAVDILSENDDSVKVTYEEGYCPPDLDHSLDENQKRYHISRSPKKDDDMRCLLVQISLRDFKKKNSDRYSGEVGFPIIEDSGDIENQITLLKYGKSLLNKFKLYSDDVHLQVYTGVMTFLIKFEVRDTSVKTEAKWNGLNKALYEYLKDYETTKTIKFTDNEYIGYVAFRDPKVKQIYDYLCKYCDEKGIITSYYGQSKKNINSLRFSISEKKDDNKCILTIGTTKFYHLKGQANIKLPNEIMNLVSDVFVDTIKKQISGGNYNLKTMPKDVTITNKDNKIIFEI
jgi:hypothetical protein